MQGLKPHITAQGTEIANEQQQGALGGGLSEANHLWCLACLTTAQKTRVKEFNGEGTVGYMAVL